MAGTAEIEAKIAEKCGKNDKIPKLALEFIGTIFLTWAWVMIWTGQRYHNDTALAIVGTAAACFALNLVVGLVAQGYCNPIIALNDAILGKIPIVEAALYVVVQFIGAFIGAAIAYGSLVNEEDGRYIRFPTRSTGWDDVEDEETGVLVGVAFGIYVVGVALYLLAFNAARHECNPLAKSHSFAAAAYALNTLGFMAAVTPQAGGMLNMAADTAAYVVGIDSFEKYLDENNSDLSDDEKSNFDDNLWVFIVAPLLGLLLGLILYVAVLSPALYAGVHSLQGGASAVKTSETEADKANTK